MEPVTNVVAQSAFSFLALVARLNFYILIPLCLAVVGFGVSYFRNYEWPAQRIREQLTHLIRQIKALRAEQGLSLDALENRLDYIFELSPFSHLWAEYRQSLHPVQKQDDSGNIKSVLATVPAETFFSKGTLVDLQINADFYRHLPGILTGIGIIGTFSGLVWGLHEFRPDPGQALESLPLLLQEVTSAFIGSGFAILAAIFITYKEKSILNQCYRLVEELNKEIDGMHATGAGEEYLSRLVSVLESSPAATRALKDALLVDLSSVMRDIAERQSLAHQQQNQVMALQISDAIKMALAEPMAQLSGVVQQVTTSEREAVGGMLEQLLAGFMSRIGDAFGQQIQGINQSLQSSSRTIATVQDAVTRSIGDISNAGMSAADKMSDKLEDSLSKALLAQQQMTAQLLQQQKQSSDVIDGAIDRISVKLEDSLSRVAQAQEKINAQSLQQQKQSSDIMDGAVERISSKLEGTLSKVAMTQEQVSKQAQEQQKQSTEIMDHAVGRISGRLEETLSKVVFAQEQVNVQVLQQQKLSTEVMGIAVDRISAKMEDTLAKAVFAQEQVSRQAQEQQKQSAETMSGTVERISVKMEETLSKAVSTQEQISMQALQQQKQSAEVLDGMASQMSGKLGDSLLKMASVQEQIGLQALQHQRQAAEIIDMTMKTVLGKMQTAFGEIAAERVQQVEQDRRRHDILMDSSQALYGRLSEQVGYLVENIQATTSRTGENLASIQSTALQAISGMKDGAGVMRDAAERFTAAGNSISGLTEVMGQTASTMQMTSLSMRQTFDEYDRMRGNVQQQVNELQGLMGTVKRENGVNSALVGEMERIVGALADVERQSKEYLDRVNEVLKRSFQEFGIEMVGQVRNISAESNKQLGASLHALSSTVDSMIASVTKLRRVG